MTFIALPPSPCFTKETHVTVEMKAKLSLKNGHPA